VTVKGSTAPDNAQADNWVVGRTYDEALASAKKKFSNVPAEDLTLEQDPDVLDTWFSSGLFPFSVFGWPEKTPDLAKFYPTTFLETGAGIFPFPYSSLLFLPSLSSFFFIFLHFPSLSFLYYSSFSPLTLPSPFPLYLTSKTLFSSGWQEWCSLELPIRSD
jgi:tRNA synthetases class I (I, L, M and V)